MKSREEFVADAILERLGHSDLPRTTSVSTGVVVENIKELDPNKVIASLLKAQRELFASSIGYPRLRPRKGLTTSQAIEDAVSWRNRAACAGKIVVFLNGQVAKRHSLEKFDRVTDRDIAASLLRLAREELNSNKQEEEFWDALSRIRTKFPLRLIEDFVDCVNSCRGEKKNQRIPRSLWRLGLVQDSNVISRKCKADERLERNRQAIEEIAQLSEQSRKRMAQVIASLKGNEKKRFEKAFQRVMGFFSRNDRDALQHLDLETLETLIRNGRPLPNSSERKKNEGSDRLSKPLSGKKT